MTKQTETGQTTTQRVPYEAPRLTMVELRPEERLLAGVKEADCEFAPGSS